MKDDTTDGLTKLIVIKNTNFTVVSTFKGEKTILEIFEKLIDELIDMRL